MTALDKNTVLHNRYQIVRLVGKGEQSTVYQAFDQELRTPVALKQLYCNDPQFVAAFAREAPVLTNLKHPSLPRLFDHFEENGQLYLVMEFIPGIDLASQLVYRGQPFAIGDVIKWGSQLLDVLEYLHSHNPPVIHGNIKPQNLKIAGNGKLILLDVGLSSLLAASNDESRATNPSHYAAPEQLQGEAPDARNDLYAVGATLYHLATGREPIDALSRATAHCNKQPDPLPSSRTLNSQIPAHLDELISQAMAISPEERPASAAAMRQALMSSAASVSRPNISPRPASLKQAISIEPSKAEMPPVNIFAFLLIFAVVAFVIGVMLAVVFS